MENGVLSQIQRQIAAPQKPMEQSPSLLRPSGSGIACMPIKINAASATPTIRLTLLLLFLLMVISLFQLCSVIQADCFLNISFDIPITHKFP